MGNRFGVPFRPEVGRIAKLTERERKRGGGTIRETSPTKSPRGGGQTFPGRILRAEDAGRPDEEVVVGNGACATPLRVRQEPSRKRRTAPFQRLPARKATWLAAPPPSSTLVPFVLDEEKRAAVRSGGLSASWGD